MSDDEPLGLPPTLPALVSPQLSPTCGSVNVLDMISQDVMFGNSFQNMTSSASTEVTYVSQYASPSATPFSSAAPFTSAGDVFLPSIPITTAANTFVKPLHTYVPPSSQSERSILKPVYRPVTDSKPENPKFVNPRSVSLSSQDPYAFSPIVSQHNPIEKTPFDELITSKSEKHKKSSKKSSSGSSKKSKSRSRGSHKSSNRSKRLKSSRSRTKAQSPLLHSSGQPSAFVPVTSRSSTLRSAVTHTITHAANTFTESSVAMATETVTYTTTVTHTVGHHAGTVARSSFKTATITSFTSTKTQSPVIEAMGAYSVIVCSNSSTTSTVTSYTVTRPRMPASIISPMESTYLPSSIMHSGPTIISRTSSTTVGAPFSTPLPSASKKTRVGKLPTQTLYSIPANRTSSEADPLFRLRTRLTTPLNTSTTSVENIVTTTATTPKRRVAHTVHPVQSAHFVTDAQTYDSSTTTATITTMATRTLTQTTFALPPGATLYTARKISPGRATRSRSAVTTEAQTFAILDGKGSYTTVKFSDVTTSAGGTLMVAHSQSTTAETTGFGTQTSSITTDTMIRPGSQLLIPIANSQINTTTSLGYLMTSPMRSDINTTRNSTTETTTPSATSIGTHTITTISSEAFNRIRNRLVYDVPSTAPGFSSLTTAATSTDSNKSRGPVRIIANHLISAVTPRDSSELQGTAASRATTRNLFSAAQTQGLFAFATPITSHSPTTILDHTGRPVNRMVAPINVPASTHANYILTTGMGSSTAMASHSKTKASRSPAHNTNTAAATMISTTVSPNTRNFPGTTGGIAYTSSCDTLEVHSKLRNRLTVQIPTTESMTTSVVANANSKNRSSQSVFAVPSGSTTHSLSTKSSHTTTLSPATMTVLTFSSPTSGGMSAPSSPRRQAAPTATHVNPPSPTTLNSIPHVTPTLTTTGNRYVIKLATTPSGTTASSVTAAVSTPITTSALSPTEHTFLEPHPVPSRLRSFPAPRTYPVAQRLAAGNQQRPSVRNVNPRFKKVIANPAPLQIFADVVCPPSTAHGLITATATQAHSKSRFTFSHTSSSPTSGASQYKNTVIKNPSSVAHVSTDRANSRFMTPHASPERTVLNRSVSFLSPRRLSPVTHTATQGTPTMISLTQRTSRSERASPVETRSQAVRESSPDYQDHLFE